MSTYPAITAAIASQHRRDLIAQAGAARLARTASQGRTARQGRSGRPALSARRLITAAAGCTAAAVLLLSPAAAGDSWASPAGTHHFASAGAVHFRHVYSHLGHEHVRHVR
jgi:hypothetical protein